VRLLVTRPEPDGNRTAEALRGRGHVVLLAPMLRMQAVDCELPDEECAAVVITSANAARAIAGHPQRARLTSLRAFTVGRHTADAARAAGFGDIRSADGDKSDLAALIRMQLGAARGPLLYLAGEDRAGELDVGEIRVRTVVVYRALKAERLPAEIETALAGYSLAGVLHFSRRTADAYLDCAARAGLIAAALRPLHFCLAQAISEPLVAAGATGIRIASRPEEEALLALVGDC
jgi:uroporphyrinogen-III synthase